jgi:hypothetical protein
MPPWRLWCPARRVHHHLARCLWPPRARSPRPPPRHRADRVPPRSHREIKAQSPSPISPRPPPSLWCRPRTPSPTGRHSRSIRPLSHRPGRRSRLSNRQTLHQLSNRVPGRQGTPAGRSPAARRIPRPNRMPASIRRARRLLRQPHARPVHPRGRRCLPLPLRPRPRVRLLPRSRSRPPIPRLPRASPSRARPPRWRLPAACPHGRWTTCPSRLLRARLRRYVHARMCPPRAPGRVPGHERPGVRKEVARSTSSRNARPAARSR